MVSMISPTKNSCIFQEQEPKVIVQYSSPTVFYYWDFVPHDTFWLTFVEVNATSNVVLVTLKNFSCESVPIGLQVKKKRQY